MICFDAVAWQDIPADAPMVAGYINGPVSQWPPEAWQRFPDAIKVHITVDPTINDGDVYDCEPGNGNPPDAGKWAKMRNRAGVVHPCIYTMPSWKREVLASIAQEGATGVVMWDAYPNGIDHVTDGSVGTQWGWHSNSTLPGQYANLNIDISTFNDTTWIQGDEMAQADIDEILRVLHELEIEVVTAKDQAKDPNGTPINLRWTAGWGNYYSSLALGEIRTVKAELDALKAATPATFTVDDIATAVIALMEKKLA